MPPYLTPLLIQSQVIGRRKISAFASMLVLDFDNGKISPEKFEDIFWHKAGKGLKRSFIICNSFSRSPRTAKSLPCYVPLQEACNFNRRTSSRFEQHRCEVGKRRLPREGYGLGPAVQKRRSILLHAMHQSGRILIMLSSGRTAPRVGTLSVMELTPAPIGRLPSPRRQERGRHSSPATFPKTCRLSLRR